ncbi:hypothetical protein WAI453_006499 [Rhynchosporium graminicola]
MIASEFIVFGDSRFKPPGKGVGVQDQTAIASGAVTGATMTALGGSSEVSELSAEDFPLGVDQIFRMIFSVDGGRTGGCTREKNDLFNAQHSLELLSSLNEDLVVLQDLEGSGGV